MCVIMYEDCSRTKYAVYKHLYVGSIVPPPNEHLPAHSIISMLIYAHYIWDSGSGIDNR